MAAPLLLCFVLTLVGLSRADPASWPEWKTQYGKRYSTSAEETLRRLIWEKNQRIVSEHNVDFHAGRTSFKMALNAFADRDQTQTRPVLMSVHFRQSYPKTPAGNVADSVPAIPTSWDWRKKGVVDPVRNQGEAGSVEAFDAADAVASFAAIQGSPLYVLSAQEVADCCLPTPLMDLNVFDCIKDHGGLCTDATYKSGTGPNVCNNASCKAVASPKNGGKQVKSGDEGALAVAVTITPVLVFVDASQSSFQLYSGGVYSDPQCSSTMLDHGLLLVGYGVDSSGVEYWICKNSWGKSWGEEGYIRIARNKGNMCGIATAPVYPY